MRTIVIQLGGFLLPLMLVSVGLMAADKLLGGIPAPFSQPYYVSAAAIQEALTGFESSIRSLEHLDMSKPDLRRWRDSLRFKIAKAEFLSGRFQAAQDHLQVLNRSEFRNYFSLIYEGICAQKSGDISRAEVLFEDAVAVFPDRHDAYIARGHLHLLTGREAEAAADYTSGVARAAVLGPVRVDIGDAYAICGDPDQAIQYYRAAHSVDPWDPFSLVRLAQYAYCKEKDTQRAQDFLRRADKALAGWLPARNLHRIIHENLECPKYLSLADEPPGGIRTWEVIPCRLLIEYQRPDWQGYETH